LPCRGFILPGLVDCLALTLGEHRARFRSVLLDLPGDQLQMLPATQILLGPAINTEKARWELIITPVRMAMHRTLDGAFSIFSGVDSSVVPATRLTGGCDFILSRVPEQYVIRAPVMVIVAARNENFIAGVGHCGATMVAARQFNGRTHLTRARWMRR